MKANKHYITTDEYGRILSGWSDGVFPDKDNTGAILLTDQGRYQFRLEQGGEENPILTNPDGTHRYIHDPDLSPAYREATAEELAAERAEIEAAREPPPAETERLDMIQEIVEMRAQLAQLQINGGM